MNIAESPVLFLILPLLLDESIRHDAKHVLLQFLDGAVNPKKRRSFHRKQKFRDRLTLDYISPLVSKKYSDQFHTLHRIYRFYLYSILPQYVFAVFLRFLFAENALVPILSGMILIRIIILVIFHVQEDSCHQLKCVQKKRSP